MKLRKTGRKVYVDKVEACEVDSHISPFHLSKEQSKHLLLCAHLIELLTNVFVFVQFGT